MNVPTYKTIHILGLGNLGKLTAHYLAASKSAPVTLLLHRPEQVGQWDEAGRSITLTTNGHSHIESSFQYEKTFESDPGNASQIHHLIVATKTYATAEALRPLRTRLNADSTILFLQNGMGTVDEVTSSLFTTPSVRPHYYTGIVTHDERGSLTPSLTRAASPKYLLQHLCKAPGLSTSEESEEAILPIQLQKLAINAVINPLTTIFDCFNGQLFDHPRRLALSRLLSEISLVISNVFASPMREKSDCEVMSNFSIPILEQIVLEAANQTAENISSMRQDMLNGRRTEIDHINGYIVEQGAQFGVDCSMNQMMIQLINEKRKLADAEIPEIFSGAKRD
ncbi:MAG: hypothetical protein Q9198_009814 [Flavoplaca austrocitrina]